MYSGEHWRTPGQPGDQGQHHHQQVMGHNEKALYLQGIISKVS